MRCWSAFWYDRGRNRAANDVYVFVESPVALIVAPFDDISQQCRVIRCSLNPGDTIYLRRVTLIQTVQVHLPAQAAPPLYGIRVTAADCERH